MNRKDPPFWFARACNLSQASGFEDELSETQRAQNIIDEIIDANEQCEDELMEDIQEGQVDGLNDGQSDSHNVSAVNGPAVSVTVPERRSRADWEVDDEDYGPLSDADFLAHERQRLSKYKVMLEKRRRQMDNNQAELLRLRAAEKARAQKRPRLVHQLSPARSMAASVARSSVYAESFLNGF